MRRLAVAVTVLFTYMALVISMLIFSTSVSNNIVSDKDNKMKAQPLLTLFTTAIDIDWKKIIHNNTFRNWALLRPQVTPILYYGSNDTLHQKALYYGWHVIKVPRSNTKGTPILKNMFMETERKFSSHFYAYANADILFDGGLIKTLEKLSYLLQNTSQVLITGRRTNVPVDTSVTSLLDILKLKRGHAPFTDNAQDYFISIKNGYDWPSLPNVVVGRVGIDNWLVVNAIVTQKITIDVTETVTAVHQTGRGGNSEGWQVPEDELYYNYAQVGRHFDYSLGSTTCTEYKTTMNSNNEIGIKHRKTSETPCKDAFKRKGMVYNNMELLNLEEQITKYNISKMK